ncbi:MAG: phytanoyl-CoA dioxygenase family protein [Gammaproteobacteria bacterium]|nr:phytanoyl-CoA dioxygenase family protein [Gammaproteobacteria bacterium]
MTELGLEQRQALVRDGFVVLRDVVPRDLTDAARRAIYLDARSNGFRRHSHDTGIDGVLADLVNKSPLSDIMLNAMGPYDAPERGFAAVLYPEPEHDLPNFGWQPHLDGSWYSPDIPKTPREVDSWQAPRTHHFGDASAAELGANMTPLFQDPARTLSLGSFTAFVGVALNDQTEFGRGNLCVLAGAHELVEEFFRYQRDNGGPVGPEGPGWPRLSPAGNGGVRLTMLPDTIRDHFLDDANTTDDGTLWLKPTPVLMDEGDAVIALHACPHGASSNFGPDPRMNVYFRFRRHRPGGAKVRGDSDHPDRGWNGEFLDYPEGHDPWRVAIDAMCDHWSEWDFHNP